MAIVQGKARVIFGGPKGKPAEVITGDVIILPAGTAHKCTNHSDDFLCVGAYPQAKDYDMNYGKEKERPKADENIKKVPLPETDPVYGMEGPIKMNWEMW